MPTSICICSTWTRHKKKYSEDQIKGSYYLHFFFLFTPLVLFFGHFEMLKIASHNHPSRAFSPPYQLPSNAKKRRCKIANYMGQTKKMIKHQQVHSPCSMPHIIITKYFFNNTNAKSSSINMNSNTSIKKYSWRKQAKTDSGLLRLPPHIFLKFLKLFDIDIITAIN